MKLLDYLQLELNKRKREFSVAIVENSLTPRSLEEIIIFLRGKHLSLYEGIDEVMGIDFCKKQFPNSMENCDKLIKDFLHYLKTNGEKEVDYIEMFERGGDIIREIVEKCEW